MPQAFVQLYPELERACREALVLTTNERLRRNLIRAFNDARVREGRRAWTTPRVQTLDAHLLQSYQRLASVRTDLPVVLSPEAEFHLFRATAPVGAAALVPLAQQAWTLCHQWSIPLTAAGFSRTENGRQFLDWTERLRRRLDGDGAITRAELATQPDLLTSEAELACLAFERPPAAVIRWLDRQAAAGCRVRQMETIARPPTSATRTAFDTPAEELAAAAQWAHRLLADSDGEPAIGIVVPDLARRHATVLRQFIAEFDPLLETGTAGILDIGGGTPLVEQAVWQGARDWLRLCFDRLPVDRARMTLNDPFLTLPRLAQMPPTLPPEVDLRILDREMQTPELREHLAALPGVAGRSASEQPLATWLEAFSASLERAGWTGRQAGSVQYQAWQEIRRRTESLGTIADLRPLSAPEALRQLDALLQTVTFAPERPAAPVQVMGYLETTGLRFSHLWVMGLDDQAWPALPSVNPFIPVRLREAHGVPRSTPVAEADFAAERLQHWQSVTDVLIVSHARQSLESELRPSPLIRELPEVTLVDLHPGRAHPALVTRQGALEQVADTAGTALPPGRFSGGTGRLRDQAVCPFRGYAIHRLGLAEPRQPHGLPDALDRGILIHEALHRLYQNSTDAGRPPQDLTAPDFERAAERALVRYYGRFPAPFREREHRRLVALLSCWNALECRREDATIEALELDVRIEFDQLGLKFRIDRMDRIDDALIVIDYKTGRIANRLNHQRLIDPQLPLYALTNPDIQGVLYAEVDDRQPRLKGTAAGAIDEAAVEPPLGGSWERQRERWQRQVDTLIREIREGVASVTPYGPAACQSCHLHAFCRVALDPDGDDPA